MLDKLFGSLKVKSGLDTAPASALSKSKPSDELERYNRIFRGSRGYAFIDWDMHSGQVHWRGGFLSHMGYEENVLSQVTEASKFLRFVHPDDHRALTQSIIRLVKSRSKRRDESIICRALKKDGGSVWVELRLEAERRSDGWVSHLSGLVSDISALKAAEEALKVSEARHARIIQSSNDGIWEWSAEGGGKRVHRNEDGSLDWSHQQGSFTFNARCWEMLGFDADDEIITGGLKSWRYLIHQGDGKRFDKTLVDHIVHRAPFDVEYRIRGKDGEWRWVRARGQASYDPEGRANKLSGTNMDITALKLAEERVVRAKEEAEKANQAKSEFLSSMSHELRTPLNAILGFTQLFEMDTNLTKKQKANIKEIKSAGNHLLELVGDVLDLAKIESGHINLSVEPVLASRVVQECAVLLKPQYEKRNVRLDLNFAGLEALMVNVDPIRLKQVLLNLMGNAAKYNKTNGQVVIVLEQLEDEYLRISVDDSGPGIPEHLQTQLFQPFNRLGAERSGIEGTGVGLVITKQLVELMGGRIDFASEEKSGSSFWVELPLANRRSNVDENSVSEDVQPSAEEEHVVDEVKTPELCVEGHKRVLYVDDKPSNQKLMEQVLARFPQLELNVVGLAVQGLYLARSTTPDLIILDVNLPGVTGYEIVEILKNDPLTKNIPVLALSANVLAHDIEKGKEAGFDRYLTKPLDLSELIEACNALLV